MTDFTYSTRLRSWGGTIEIGVYDPERWEGEGGIRFGFSAEIIVDDGASGDAYSARVSMGAAGSNTPADAALRLSVYRQAITVAAWIEERLAEGISWEGLDEVVSRVLWNGSVVSHEITEELLDDVARHEAAVLAARIVEPAGWVCQHGNGPQPTAWAAVAGCPDCFDHGARRSFTYPATCPACGGTGGGQYNDCPACDGNGVV